VGPIAEILKRVPAKTLMQLYKIASFLDADQFLMLVAHSRGKLRKGGIPDMQAAAKVVLQVRSIRYSDVVMYRGGVIGVVNSSIHLDAITLVMDSLYFYVFLLWNGNLLWVAGSGLLQGRRGP
jgi:hypothetical protein